LVRKLDPFKNIAIVLFFGVLFFAFTGRIHLTDLTFSVWVLLSLLGLFATSDQKYSGSALLLFLGLPLLYGAVGLATRNWGLSMSLLQIIVISLISFSLRRRPAKYFIVIMAIGVLGYCVAQFGWLLAEQALAIEIASTLVLSFVPVFASHWTDSSVGESSFLRWQVNIQQTSLRLYIIYLVYSFQPTLLSFSFVKSFELWVWLTIAAAALGYFIFANLKHWSWYVISFLTLMIIGLSLNRDDGSITLLLALVAFSSAVGFSRKAQKSEDSHAHLYLPGQHFSLGGGPMLIFVFCVFDSLANRSVYSVLAWLAFALLLASVSWIMEYQLQTRQPEPADSRKTSLQEYRWAAIQIGTFLIVGIRFLGV